MYGAPEGKVICGPRTALNRVQLCLRSNLSTLSGGLRCHVTGLKTHASMPQSEANFYALPFSRDYLTGRTKVDSPNYVGEATIKPDESRSKSSADRLRLDGASTKVSQLVNNISSSPEEAKRYVLRPLFSPNISHLCGPRTGNVSEFVR